MYEMLNKYEKIEEIRKMNYGNLNNFAKEIRSFLIEKVSKTGGHLASNLGVVELTLSLYHVFDFNKDKLIWDVGHQAYVHKLLTGRKDKFDTLRKYGGMSGFPKECESPYDMFQTGHSSTSISAALGMARVRDLNGAKYHVVSVIGDGALTGGMALEALNDVGFSKSKVIIILNDNEMSIEKNVGGLSVYLSKMRLDPKYNKIKENVNTNLRKIPNIGNGMANSIEKLKDGIKQIVVPGMFFEDMGIKYLGPIDGHNIKQLSEVLSMAKGINRPVLIHIITKKGKGYCYAEENPGKFHGIGPFDCDSGEVLSGKSMTYSSVFGNSITELAKENKKIVAITAAMKDGTGLRKFADMYPNRFFDVGIAEQHAVTMAAGMAKAGFKPVFAVYSTFLQRAYDQVLHDVCIQKLPVVFAIDRAGIVGEDGETHQGIFDLSYLSQIPNMTIMAPKCIDEVKFMLKWAIDQNFPIAIRYPRGGDEKNLKIKPLSNFSIGKWEIISSGEEVAVIATGKMLQSAYTASEKLKNIGINITLINACFVKPIDRGLIKSLMKNNFRIMTIEDNIIHGGFGSLVLEYYSSIGGDKPFKILGYDDEFVTHGNTDILYKKYGLDADGICDSIIKFLK